ncbi:Transcriptional regulatory protein DevR (DosR) [Nonomuraea coxensis DSM 45129]|uniref:Transcriptional regulatory protein DevR (DosR) n=1 Tax=Nonomuraea coxensis DSM 45129 TaxID=1122611 RepID=A0ABX8U459_9ACTN|nr:response regulator transcription factor [Nonomuraea coxensis]QYC42408.1 Transcriptional regulatory protein DevR (DosR) [Nonomuraea coxensis DSM 45129]
MIRVLLADDQHLVREALAALLGLEPDLEVVGQVSRGDEVSPAVTALRPDVVLLDIEMPGRDGLTVAGDLAGVRVIILTTFGRPGYLRRAMDAGVAGYVVKDARAGELADAVRRVHAGGRVFDRKLAAASVSAGANPLTGRERDVLRAATEGGTVADIARRLHLSDGTVRNYLSSAIGKLGVRNRAEAARAAEAKGWL